MTIGVITLILGILAFATFWAQGRQWPTFIFATLFGICLGVGPVGPGVVKVLRSFFGAFAGWFA